ncbi:MAG: hypothetical protein U0Q11_08845 [Vicinamibacterales bacterium]
MSRGGLLLCAVCASLVVMTVRPTVAGQGRGQTTRPAFDGLWNSATATPLERPASLRDKAFFTPEEAAAWESRVAQANAERPIDRSAPSTDTGTYNTFFREFGSQVVKTRRTSIVVDPPDGRIPPLTPAAAARRRERLGLMRALANPEDAGLQDRCLAMVTAGPPMLPYSYNSNYQFMLTERALVIHVEMIHDARVIRLDGSPHVSASIRRWLGDSIGHFEGATLVVDTTNFDDERGFYGDAGGNFSFDRNLHLVERFSLLDASTMLYQFEIDDPTTYARPWKGEVTLSRTTGPIYEYACHEGNYSLPNMLRGYRVTEQQSAQPSSPR